MGHPRIVLADLELWTRIGVPDVERGAQQRILATITLAIAESAAGKTDRLEDTVDYEAIERKVKALAKSERKTLEKLAEDIAGAVLENAKIRKVTVTLRKFILPGAREVTLVIERQA